MEKNIGSQTYPGSVENPRREEAPEAELFKGDAI
jgi:hypothetical protein